MSTKGAIQGNDALPQLCVTSLLLPEQYNTRHSRTLVALKRIQSVAVRSTVKRNGHRFYVIDVHMKLGHSRIPSVNASASTSATILPLERANSNGDVRVLRRFSEFSNLRDEMYYHAHSGHGDKPCGFCSQLVAFTQSSECQPRLHTKLFSNEEQLCRLLEEYLNVTLSLISSIKTFSAHKCDGQQEIPQLLEAFLSPSETR
ncbi:hypothetical protein PINS_up023088 [Pythium insidiosum]|nr:hypothetical protein PINS_up023088 [Pythium insidiosum]